MIRFKRALRRPDSDPGEAEGPENRHLRLVVPRAGEACEDAPPEPAEAVAPRSSAPKSAYEDPHAFVRTYVDPRNIYLA